MTTSFLTPRIRKRKHRPIVLDGDVALITLTRGLTAIVDASDANLVDGRNWYALWGRGGLFCAATHIKTEHNNTDVALMHRVILSAPDDAMVDHINGDRLDNRRSNLRLATPQQNSWNQAVGRRNTSGYKGVSWHSRDLVFQASIRVSGRQVTIGSFVDVIDAARAYDAAAREHHGKFARVNFPG